VPTGDDGHAEPVVAAASGSIDRVIVRLTVQGAVVQDPDDLGSLHLRTDLDPDGMRTALVNTGTGEPAEDGTVLLDVAVLRSLAVMSPTAPDWPQRWAAMVAEVDRKGMLTPDRRSVRLRVERVQPGA
jgi:hypothetical protein